MKFSKYLKLNEWEDDFDDTYDEFAEYDERDECEISKCEERLKIELNNLVKKYNLNVDDYEETCFDINGSCSDKLYNELKRIAKSCNLILKKDKFSQNDKYHFYYKDIDMVGYIAFNKKMNESRRRVYESSNVKVSELTDFLQKAIDSLNEFNDDDIIYFKSNNSNMDCPLCYHREGFVDLNDVINYVLFDDDDDYRI